MIRWLFTGPLRLLLRFMSNKSSSKVVNFNNHAVKFYEAPIFSPKQVDLPDGKSDALSEVKKVLESGGVVALPSDTVYGIVTLLKFSPKLFYVKKRLPTKPVGLFISSPDVIKRYAKLTIDERLLNKLLPGPVTLLFKRIPSMTEGLHLNNDLVGFRIPDNDFIQKLCQQFDEPLAQTSANLSGEPSAIKPEEFTAIWENLDLIIVDSNNKMDESRVGSTIIDLSETGTYKIIRDGCSLPYYEKILRDSNLLERS